MFNIFVIINLLIYLFILCKADYLLVCHKADPNLNQCMYNSVSKLKPYLVRGIPEYDIPGLEPILLGDLIVADSNGNNGQGLSITANDINAYGASDFNLKKFK